MEDVRLLLNMAYGKARLCQISVNRNRVEREREFARWRPAQALLSRLRQVKLRIKIGFLGFSCDSRFEACDAARFGSGGR